MRTHSILIALGVVAQSLSACNKVPSEPPVPTVSAVQIEPRAAPGGALNTSVPPADSVLAPASETKRAPEAGRSNSTMTRAQEANAMPIPGQNNDHSAPLAPAKRASGP